MNDRVSISEALIAAKRKEFLAGHISLTELLAAVQHEAWICGINRGRYDEQMAAAKKLVDGRTGEEKA